MDIRSLAAQAGYLANRSPISDPIPAAPIARHLDDFATTLSETESVAKAALAGDADPHALVTALAQSELAVETVVAMRNKVVEAYQEILRMPV